MTIQNKEASARKGIRPAAVAVMVMTIILTGCLLALGTWQVNRLSWKRDLVARVEERAHASPVEVPAASDWPALTDPAQYEYRRVKITGTFRHQDEVQVYTVTDLGPGYWVLTPLERQDRTRVIINRGFVPTDKRDPATRPQGEVEGAVEIVGLMRAPETGGLFLRTNDPQNDRWYSRNIAQITDAKKIENAAPFYIDADATANPGSLPVGGKTMLTFPNNHLSYAITWYILAGMVVAAGWYVMRNLNAPKDER
ncbi:MULTISPECIES: SURF1 family protein [unclassified Rhizobium]|uniref:SURF1 family protein n=1 Tax=unclassified Rhizobium TaxID=2613769 RepID=UPI001784F3B0|nr:MULTISPECIES: SURF1 family protein [unclassified Rhizobium]MBD8686192.1 SURF1 family protein [Rhizobium sp. CFBP 13644]MBD8690135.1 SURF1 family protein [Rhizobium sp. CFBP 13717]